MLGIFIEDPEILVLVAILVIGLVRSGSHSKGSVYVSLTLDVLIIGLISYSVSLIDLWSLESPNEYVLTGDAIPALIHAMLEWWSGMIGALVIFGIPAYITHKLIQKSKFLDDLPTDALLIIQFSIPVTIGILYTLSYGNPIDVYEQISPLTDTGKSQHAFLGIILAHIMYFTFAVKSSLNFGGSWNLSRQNIVLVLFILIFVSPIFGMISGIAAYRLDSLRQIFFIFFLFICVSLFVIEYRLLGKSTETTSSNPQQRQPDTNDRISPQKELETVQRSPETAEDINVVHPDEEFSARRPDDDES